MDRGDQSSAGGPSGRGRPRRPALFGPVVIDAFVGGTDPALRMEAAHLTAQALLRFGRGGADEQATARLVALTDQHGLDEVADLWAECAGDTLPGALWRVYALRAGIRADASGMARAFDAGRRHAPVDEAVAGVAEPPGPPEVVALADAVLAGAFTGDLAVALERAAAFCRVVATGRAVLADEPAGGPDPDPDPLALVVRRAANLQRTAHDLDRAAGAWRLGELS